MARVIRGFMAILVAGVSVLTLGGAVGVAYQIPVPHSVIVTVPGTSVCFRPVVIHATVLDASGHPVVGQVVDWSFVGATLPNDSLTPRHSTTNSHGVATTTATVSITQTPSYRRVIKATAGAAFGTATITISCQLPPTDTALQSDAPGFPGTPLAIILLSLVSVFSLGGAMLAWRRTRSR